MALKAYISRFIFFIKLLVVASVVACFWLMSYEDLTDFFVKWGNITRVEQFKNQFYTTNTHHVLKWLGTLCFVLLISLRGQVIVLISSGIDFVSWLRFHLRNSYIQLTTNQRAVLWGVTATIFFLRIGFLCFWEYYEDEQFSYQYMVSKGFLTTLVYYPGPNNHVLSNLIAAVFSYGLSELWAMRFPTILISCTTFYLSTVMLMKRKPFKQSVLTALVLQFSFNYMLYSFQGRGYALEIFFSILTLYCWWRFSETRDKNYRVLFIISAVLGFLTIPVFVFPFVSIVSFFLLRNKESRSLILACFIVGILSLGVYLPVFVVSGWDAVFANSWVNPLSMQTFVVGLPSYMLGLQDWLWDFPNWGSFVTLFFGALVVVKFRKRAWFWPAVLAVSAPVVIIAFQRVHPFPRVWCYVSVIQVLVLVEVFNLLPTDKAKYFVVLVALASSIYSFYLIF